MEFFALEEHVFFQIFEKKNIIVKFIVTDQTSVTNKEKLSINSVDVQIDRNTVSQQERKQILQKTVLTYKILKNIKQKY